MLSGVLQGSIRGTPFFNIFYCDIIFVTSGIDVDSYAEDITLFLQLITWRLPLEKIKNDSLELFKWFCDNQIKTNIEI